MEGSQKCERCDALIDHRHGHICSACIAEEMDFTDNECANCGGEGFTYGCGWDWQCNTYDEGEGTCLCTRRCEWCNPQKLTEQEISERQRLRDVLAGALPTTPQEAGK